MIRRQNGIECKNDGSLQGRDHGPSAGLAGGKATVMAAVSLAFQEPQPIALIDNDRQGVYGDPGPAEKDARQPVASATRWPLAGGRE